MGDEPGATEDPVAGVPSGFVLVAVAIGATGVTWVVADAESGTSDVLLLPGTMGAADVVVVPLLMSCRLAKATILLAIDASSLCSASAAVLSFSNIPCVNFLGEWSCRAACKAGASTWSSSRSNSSRSDCGSDCAFESSGVCAMADDVTRVRRRKETGRSLRSDNMVVQLRRWRYGGLKEACRGCSAKDAVSRRAL